MTEVLPSIPGQQVSGSTLYELRRLVGELARTGRPSFPGSQPVSFTRTHTLPELLNEDYFVCEKSDGVRVLILMIVAQNGPQTYFITRKNEYYLSPYTCFPVPNNERFDQFHHKTLIDGELVIDTEPDGRQIRKLLGFDVLCVAGTSCMERSLESRLGYLNDHIIRPFNRMCRRVSPDYSRNIPIIAEMKSFQRSYGVPLLYNEVIPKLKHKSDGLIFTSVSAPYSPGTSQKIIKWKPAGENSIDFKLRVIRDPTPQIILMVWHGDNKYVDYAPLAMHTEDWLSNFSRIPDLDGRIAEVVYDPKYSPPAMWRFMRFRDDKPHGNHISVVDRIIESIKDNLELDELNQYMPQIRDNWKRRHP
ncbi:Dcp1p-Dcp2p decapping enzyme complex alpha subunit [Coemansia sp. RSA 1365]|nr:Dcp1p-Dcp2p decapping enzyme complex alpha subunit [Coemansia sp. RSA 1365]